MDRGNPRYMVPVCLQTGQALVYMMSYDSQVNYSQIHLDIGDQECYHTPSLPGCYFFDEAAYTRLKREYTAYIEEHGGRHYETTDLQQLADIMPNLAGPLAKHAPPPKVLPVICESIALCATQNNGAGRVELLRNTVRLLNLASDKGSGPSNVVRFFSADSYDAVCQALQLSGCTIVRKTWSLFDSYYMLGGGEPNLRWNMQRVLLDLNSAPARAQALRDNELANQLGSMGIY